MIGAVQLQEERANDILQDPAHTLEEEIRSHRAKYTSAPAESHKSYTLGN